MKSIDVWYAIMVRPKTTTAVMHKTMITDSCVYWALMKPISSNIGEIDGTLRMHRAKPQT